jgi:hypothetical protein
VIQVGDVDYVPKAVASTNTLSDSWGQLSGDQKRAVKAANPKVDLERILKEIDKAATNNRNSSDNKLRR